MKMIINWVNILSARLESVSKFIAILAIILMFIVIVLQVIARYVFASPPVWTEEVGKILMIWGGLLGTSIAFKKRQDIVLYNPSDKKRPIRLLRGIARFLFVSGFALIILYHSPAFLERSLGVDYYSMQGVPVIWSSAAVPCFISLIFIHNIDHILQLFKNA